MAVVNLREIPYLTYQDVCEVLRAENALNTAANEEALDRANASLAALMSIDVQGSSYYQGLGDDGHLSGIAIVTDGTISYVAGWLADAEGDLHVLGFDGVTVKLTTETLGKYSAIGELKFSDEVTIYSKLD